MRRPTFILATLVGSLIVGALYHFGTTATAAATHLSGPFVVETYGAGTTCATASGAGDICAASDIEANANLDIGGTSTLTGAVTMAAALAANGGITLQDDDAITLGTGSDAEIIFEAANQAPDTLWIGVGTESRQIVIGESADSGTDLTIAQQTNPTINLHSADSADALDYITLAHDQTNGVLDVGQGDVKVADSLQVVGDTLTSGGTDDYGVKITHTLNDTGAAGGSDLYNGIFLNVTQTDVTGWDTVNAMDLQVDASSVFTVGNTGIVTTVAGVDLPVPVGALEVIRFCGNGPNATTTTYIGPVRLEDMEGAPDGTAVEDDFEFGGTGCDGQDNTTEATADEVWHASFAFKPVAMVCTSTCGTDDTMTLQLRDDAADVTGMTCNITLAGAAAQCSVRDTTPATVAANSAIAVSVVNSTDDDCSSGDVECKVFITY